MSRSRNWLAIHAHFRTGAGSHGDDAKDAQRDACRGRFDPRDFEEDDIEEEDLEEKEIDLDTCKS